MRDWFLQEPRPAPPRTLRQFWRGAAWRFGLTLAAVGAAAWLRSVLLIDSRIPVFLLAWGFFCRFWGAWLTRDRLLQRTWRLAALVSWAAAFATMVWRTYS